MDLMTEYALNRRQDEIQILKRQNKLLLTVLTKLVDDIENGQDLTFSMVYAKSTIDAMSEDEIAKLWQKPDKEK